MMYSVSRFETPCFHTSFQYSQGSSEGCNLRKEPCHEKRGIDKLFALWEIIIFAVIPIYVALCRPRHLMI